LIPARGGSKRLPRKNIVEFFGKPIIAHTIEAARSAQIFQRLIVSTEDDEIADVAKRCGAEVDPRPPLLATDNAPITEVCMEMLDRLDQAGERFQTLTVLYATAPLRSADDIKATLSLVESGRCDFAIAATEFIQPFHQALRIGDDDVAEPVFHDLVSTRKDRVPEFVAGNGSTYCAAVGAFRRARTFYGSPLGVHRMPWSRSIDIDTAEDLALARFCYERLLRTQETK
jgi:CMP-N-acetylneuraminic acid synthetase